MAPRAVTPGAVCEVSAQLDNGRVDLSWQADPCGEGGPAVRFRVFRCRRRIQGAPCPECPCSYSAVAVLDNSPPVDTPGRMRYADFVRPGFEYRYRVVPVGPGGRRGPESEIVRVPWPLEE
ncbi:MAG: hypothetical protein ABIJ95_01295 [Pseudomonadota bacterium]